MRIRIDLANRNRPVDVDLLRERKQFESCFHSQFGRQCIIYTHSTINLLLDISDRFMISAKVNTTRNVAIQLATLDNFDNSNNSNLNKNWSGVWNQWFAFFEFTNHKAIMCNVIFKLVSKLANLNTVPCPLCFPECSRKFRKSWKHKGLSEKQNAQEARICYQI